MKKIAVSVLGHDRPGIIAAVSGVLCEYRWNIEDVSQTILQTTFAGVFIASASGGEREEDLLEALRERLQGLGLSVLIKPVEVQPDDWLPPKSDPFVITTLGPDRIGLVAGITDVMARFGVNIANLKAVFRGGADPRRNVMIYEVEIPLNIDQNGFRSALVEKAGELGLDVSLQHRDVFESIHRV